ncbi:hypothetical protein PRIPAC_79643 [Pristionchus pacificus]|uniref:UBP-type domain-containing protein n=1 Tax=Pristionchus pacificus TaxID=54126 RepID=A0A454XU71_PRIPA|nr:hypothetical protein PRIPAC_79643 [Pristionchus pacificus]|eukprot:PDM75577.1 hypothetical protein PRIPAC_42754 [Pristionchus pacificus]
MTTPPPSSSPIPPGAFAVVPKKDCPHVTAFISGVVPDGGVPVEGSCVGCRDRSENWVCLTCFNLNCARAVNGCSIGHAEQSSHPIVLSLSDLSVWCYGCDEYISHEVLFPFKLAAYRRKFGENPPNNII